MGSKNYKIAGQSAPSAGTPVELYKAPLGKEFVGSTLSVCNQHLSEPASFNIAVVPAGQTLSKQHYLVFQRPIDQRDTQFFTIGMTLAPNDAVHILSSSSDLSFSLFGTELSI